MCLHTVLDISSLVVVESGLFSVHTMMMYTHPVSSTSQFIVFINPLPLLYGGVTRLAAITGISEINILPEIHIYLVNIVLNDATIFISHAPNISCRDYELWSWFGGS